MRLLALSCLVASSLFAQTNLVLMGGGDYYAPTIQRFCDLAGGRKGRVLVIPWASSSGEGAFEHFKSAVNQHMGTNSPTLFKVDFVTKPERSPEGSSDLLDAIASATGIFFTGGDQNTLMEKLKTHPKWIPALRQKFHRGTVFGGSSAGTAFMPETMMTGNGDETVVDPQKVQTSTGLGLVTGVLVDQHFIKRQRQNRLFSLLLRGPECFGFGVDEDNGVHISNDDLVEVLGPGLVMTADRCARHSDFSVAFHQPGEKFYLKR